MPSAVPAIGDPDRSQFDVGRAPHAREFTIARASGLGPVVAVLMIVSLLELCGVELLVRPKSALLANVFLFFGAYGALAFFGDWRAVKRRPFVLDDEALWVRVGGRKEGRIPLRDIERIEPVGSFAEPIRKKNRAYLRCTAFGPPQLLLWLRTPARFDERIGGSRTASCVGVTVDDDAGFVDAIRARIHRQESAEEALR